MKTGKRILGASLSMALCLYLMPVGALAAETNESAMETGCICTELCTEEVVNAECPVCSAEDADLAQCVGTKNDESAAPSDATDSTVSDVQALIDELPAVEELKSMDQKQQQLAYEQAQRAYDEYNALTNEQQAQIVGVDTLDVVLAYFAAPSVMADGLHACENVENAVALTSDGGALADGSYYLPEDITLSNDLVINGTVTLCLNGHVLTGSGSGSVITVGDNASFTLCDCRESTTNMVGTNTYSGGVITGGTGSNDSDDSDPHGGGVHVNDGATFTMNGGNIAENSTKIGGGVYVKGTFVMNSGTIAGNKTNGIEGGAGVYLGGGAEFTMKDGSISNNTASHYGGGVFGGPNYNAATFTMEGGTISGNTACYGGGVYLDGTFIMKDGTITGNTATSSTLGYGAGVYMKGGTFTMEDGKITNNDANYTGTQDFATAYGGGVFLNIGAVFNMKGGTIAGNTATTRGNGVYNYYSEFYLTGGYFGDNSIYVDPNVVDYTEFSGGYFANKETAEPYLADGYAIVDISQDASHYGDPDYRDGYSNAVYKAGSTDYSVENVTATYGTGFTPAVTGNDHNAAVTFTYKDSNGSPIAGTPTAVRII